MHTKYRYAGLLCYKIFPFSAHPTSVRILDTLHTVKLPIYRPEYTYSYMKLFHYASLHTMCTIDASLTPLTNLYISLPQLLCPDALGNFGSWLADCTGTCVSST